MKVEHYLDDGKLLTRYTEDVGAILDACHAARDLTPETGKYRHAGMMYRMASIPASVVVQWMNEGINVYNPTDDDRKRIRQKLNGEFKYLKTMDARL